MNLRFWKKDAPKTRAPAWTRELSRDDRRKLARNLRAILDPKRSVAAESLKASAPLR